MQLFFDIYCHFVFNGYTVYKKLAIKKELEKNKKVSWLHYKKLDKKDL